MPRKKWANPVNESGIDTRIDRRKVLKGIGAGVVSVAGVSGVASAHHVADLAVECGNPEDFPQDPILAGQSFDARVHFQSGHGSEACFVAAISNDGGSTWTKVGENIQSGLSLGEHVHFQLTSDIPLDADGGTYTWRVSATERPVPGQFCPHPGEDDSERSFVRWHDCEIEIVPPLEVDIKPCSDPNAINPDANGVIPVGIKQTDLFNPVERLDVSTLRFGAPDVVEGGGGASPAHGGHVEDVVPCEGDGMDDLVVHFPTEDTGFDGDEDIGRLEGMTNDGTQVFGEDSVKLVGGGNGGGGGGGTP